MEDDRCAFRFFGILELREYSFRCASRRAGDASWNSIKGQSGCRCVRSEDARPRSSAWWIIRRQREQLAEEKRQIEELEQKVMTCEALEASGE
jgi:hypothetical protein